MQIELSSHRFPREEAIPRKETASSCLLLEAEIDLFQLKEGREE